MWKRKLEAVEAEAVEAVEAVLFLWKRKRMREKSTASASIRGKNGERKEIGSAILRRRTNGGSINIKK